MPAYSTHASETVQDIAALKTSLGGLALLDDWLYFPAALRLLPGLFLAPPPLPFILVLLNPRMSALLSASPLLEKRFFPP